MAIINLFAKENLIGIMINAGYKTDGYVEGEKLSKRPVIRIGLAFTEGNKLTAN